MSESANIGLTVGANIDPLRRDMNQAAGYVSQFGSDATTSLGRFSHDAGALIGKAATAFTALGAAGVAGLTAITVAGANFIDGQSKLARQLVGTVEGINALQYAADGAGVAIEPLSEQIRKMNLVLANPSQDAKKTLDALGLSAKELLALDVDARVAAFADKFDELGYALPQVDDALKKLGADGKEMGQLLIEGGEGIRAAREELVAWGFAINDIDAQKIEAAGDSFAKVERIMSGVGQVIAAKVAPYIEDLITKFTEAAKTGGGAGGLIAKGFEPVFSTITFVINAVSGISRAFEIAGKLIATMLLDKTADMWEFADAIINGPAKAVNWFIESLNKLTGKDIQFRVAAFDNDFGQRAATARQAVTEAMDDIKSRIEAPLAGTAIENWAAGVKESLDSAKAAAGDFAGGETGGVQIPVDNTEAMNALDEFAEKLDQETKVKLDAWADSLKMPESDEIFDKFASDADKYRAHWDEMNKIAVGGAGAVAKLVAENFGNAAGSTAAAGKSMLESFSQSSRKMFEVNKAWGYADAIISTAQGIAKGVSLGFPAGIPAVAWAVATGAAQIAKIRSQTFGGGGSAPSTGAAGGGAATVPQGQPSPETESRGGSLRIEGFDPSHLYRGDQLQNMAGALEEFWNDGGGKGRVIFAGKK